MEKLRGALRWVCLGKVLVKGGEAPTERPWTLLSSFRCRSYLFLSEYGVVGGVLFFGSIELRQAELESRFLVLQKSLGIDRRHASGAGGRDGLAVDVILDIAGSEDTGHAGLGAVVSNDVPG